VVEGAQGFILEIYRLDLSGIREMLEIYRLDLSGIREMLEKYDAKGIYFIYTYKPFKYIKII
jgi:hypothetical protein